MFTVVYEKETGKVIAIANESDPNNLKVAIGGEDGNKDFIFVDELPFVNQYRQEMVVVDGKLTVVDLELTEAQERWITELEIQQEINGLKEKLERTDYKAIKYAEGEMSADEYEPIRTDRRMWRLQINELEERLTRINAKTFKNI